MIWIFGQLRPRGISSLGLCNIKRNHMWCRFPNQTQWVEGSLLQRKPPVRLSATLTLLIKTAGLVPFQEGYTRCGLPSTEKKSRKMRHTNRLICKLPSRVTVQPPNKPTLSDEKYAPKPYEHGLPGSFSNKRFSVFGLHLSDSPKFHFQVVFGMAISSGKAEFGDTKSSG